MTSPGFHAIDHGAPVGLGWSLNGRSLQIQDWLRVMPGRRLVARCTNAHDGKSLIAKIFMGNGSAHSLQRELASLALVTSAGVRCPTVIDSGEVDPGTSVLLLEDLGKASRATPTEMLRVMRDLSAVGLAQSDPHADNFMMVGDTCALLDAGSIRKARTSDVDASAGRLFASLDAVGLPTDFSTSAAQVELAARIFGYESDRARISRLRRRLDVERSRLAARRASKSERNCTEFVWVRDRQGIAGLVRDGKATLEPWLWRLDELPGEVLKSGNTAHVRAVDLDGRRLVVKRWSARSTVHGLRQRLRMSRGRRAWRGAQYLRQAGIPTPAPIALVESSGPLRSPVWLVCEYSPGIPLDEAMVRADPSEQEEAVAAVAALWARLADWRLAQRDAKASNFLWHAGGGLEMIDLDDLQSASGAKLTRLQQSQTARFLRNFSGELHSMMRSAVQSIEQPSS